jgi:hypothetical protein
MNRNLRNAFVASCAYSAALSTPYGRRLRLEHTWFTVVVGTLLTIWFYLRQRPDPELTVLKFFIATGLPIVGACLAEDMERRGHQYQWVIHANDGRIMPEKTQTRP